MFHKYFMILCWNYLVLTFNSLKPSLYWYLFFLYFLASLKNQGSPNLFHHMSVPFGVEWWNMQVFGTFLREDKRCKSYLFCLHGCIDKFSTVWPFRLVNPLLRRLTSLQTYCIYFCNAVWRCIQDGWWLGANEFQTYGQHVQCYNGRIFSRGDTLGFWLLRIPLFSIWDFYYLSYQIWMLCYTLICNIWQFLLFPTISLNSLLTCISRGFR